MNPISNNLSVENFSVSLILIKLSLHQCPTCSYRPYPLFIICSMSFLWSLCALSAISPAFLAPAEPCSSTGNCTFYTVQDEFQLTNSFVLEPAELVTSVYFLGNLMVGQFFAVVADRWVFIDLMIFKNLKKIENLFFFKNS